MSVVTDLCSVHCMACMIAWRPKLPRQHRMQVRYFPILVIQSSIL